MYLPIACPAGTHIPKTKGKKQVIHVLKLFNMKQEWFRESLSCFRLWNTLDILPVSLTFLSVKDFFF